MKNSLFILLIFIIETILLWIFLRYIYIPNLYENTVFLDFKIIVIIFFGTNIIAFGIFHYLKKLAIKKVFLINSFLSVIILISFYNTAADNYYSNNYILGNFKDNYFRYSLLVNKKKKDYLLCRTDERKNLTNILAGKIEVIEDKIILHSIKEKFVLENDSIKGFEGKNFKLKGAN